MRPAHAAGAATPANRARGGLGAIAAAACIWILIVLLIVPEGFDYEVGTLGRLGLEGSIGSRAIWIGLLLFGVFGTLGQWGRARRLLAKLNPFLLAFVALAAASILWSIEPATTVKRVVRAITILSDATALALFGWHASRFQNVIRPILTLILIGSLIFGLLAPDLAMEQTDKVELKGALHGLALQKNSMGSLASFGLIFWLHAWLTRQSGVIAVLGGACALACLVWSRSSTSIMATVFAVTLLLMLLRSPVGLRRYMPYLVTAFSTLILIYSLAVLQLVPGLDIVLAPITSLTGKDLTFSGRTAIWTIINEHIRENPFLGTGYGAYWIGIFPWSPSYQFVTRLWFYPTQSHNGYLEVINDLGMIGGACLIGYLIVFLVQSVRLMRIDRAQAALYLALLFQQFLANLSESRWFSVAAVEFAILCVASTAMARALQEARAGRIAPAAVAQVAAAGRAGAVANRGRPSLAARQGADSGSRFIRRRTLP